MILNSNTWLGHHQAGLCGGSELTRHLWEGNRDSGAHLAQGQCGRAVALYAPTDVRLALGDSVCFWFQPPGRSRWWNRTLMANANSSGIHLTAGHGGRGRRGALRLCMVDRQQPPANAWDAAKLNVPTK
jgi:hypothetical protein